MISQVPEKENNNSSEKHLYAVQKENGGAEHVKKRKDIQNAKCCFFYTTQKNHKTKLKGIPVICNSPKSRLLFHMFYCRINIKFQKQEKKLTLRLSKVLTVCAKSLTLPGDAVPCPLGPEDTREPSMTSKPESKASEQLQ